MQLSLVEMLSRVNEKNATKKKFVDLFCGAGGASEGARLAGYEVVLAIDSCKDAIEVHALNHPETTHLCVNLPVEYDLPLPRSGENWHLHGSPPCTRVSVGNQQRDPIERQRAVDLVEWYIRFAVESTAVSWSMEHVATPIVLDCLKKFKALKLGPRFDFEVVDFFNYGVPQHRRRVIAGSSDVVSRLRRIQPWKRSAAEVLSSPRGTHIRNNLSNSNPKRDPTGNAKWLYKRYGHDEACVPITGPSHVVVASRLLKWATPYSGAPLVIFNPREIAELQCFSSTYRLHETASVSTRHVGNALPPTIMYQLLCGKPK